MEKTKIFSLKYKNAFTDAEIVVTASSMASAISIFERYWYDLELERPVPELLSVTLLSSNVLA